MKISMGVTVLGVSMLGVVSQACGDAKWGGRSGADTPLELAHSAYLKGDYMGMVQNSHRALVDSKNDPAVVTNVSSLMTHAESNGAMKDVAVDWKMPAGVTKA